MPETFDPANQYRAADGTPHDIRFLIHALPKAELHVHLEGSIAPRTAVELAARHGVSLSEHDVTACYAPGDFAFFLDAFKWVTSFLRTPRDYALIAERLAENLLAQNVVYAEVTLSIGVMLIRKQDPLANYAAIREMTRQFEARGLRLNWIFDAVRQFGVPAAQGVARIAIECEKDGVVAFGIGGDEIALPAARFAKVYESLGPGIGRVIHAGEIGPATGIREAIDTLGVTRIGHGIAAVHDPRLMDFLRGARRRPGDLPYEQFADRGACATTWIAHSKNFAAPAAVICATRAAAHDFHR